MPTILLTAWKIWQPVAAILAPVLAIALVTLWIVDTGRLHAAASDNNALRAQIDDPNTGFRAQLSRSQANAAQLRANQETLSASLTADDAAVTAWQAQASKASQQAADAAKRADLAITAANNAAALASAAQPPAQASYGAIVGVYRGRP